MRHRRWGCYVLSRKEGLNRLGRLLLPLQSRLGLLLCRCLVISMAKPKTRVRMQVKKVLEDEVILHIEPIPKSSKAQSIGRKAMVDRLLPHEQLAAGAALAKMEHLVVAVAANSNHLNATPPPGPRNSALKSLSKNSHFKEAVQNPNSTKNAPFGHVNRGSTSTFLTLVSASASSTSRDGLLPPPSRRIEEGKIGAGRKRQWSNCIGMGRN